VTNNNKSFIEEKYVNTVDRKGKLFLSLCVFQRFLFEFFKDSSDLKGLFHVLILIIKAQTLNKSCIILCERISAFEVSKNILNCNVNLSNPFCICKQ